MPTQSGKTLFSQHYLDTRLPLTPEWAEDVSGPFGELRDLYERQHELLPTLTEAQTEDEFIKPALDTLGWQYIVQPRHGRGGNLTRPDYALFADDAMKRDAQRHHKDDNAFYGRALAIAEAKYWDRPLSKKDSEGRDEWRAEGNPSHQIVSYLAGTRVSWGILTNGKTWRLYNRDAGSIASEFYEVDLEAIVTAGDEDAFRRFWLFFRRNAFVPDAKGDIFVSTVLEGSTTYAREISDKLKELVFQEVMPYIANGFIAYRRAQPGITGETPESLRAIYAASLALLYKLLFLLYAEARGLLPMANPAYREESLTTLAKWAADRLDNGRPISDATHATAKYNALLALFRRIDLGDPALDVPRYDGGMFDPGAADNQFLEAHRLSDLALARAVDILVRDAGEAVDYAYISVRNLGTIYEGLLEHHLVMEPDGRAVLANDKGERKASGSYYTPDYIVEYIVQQTLDPILDARTPAFGAAMDRIAALRGKLAHDANPILREGLEDAERDAREAFLGVKVCDPAMGSGHFLVNAVDHLTDGIIRRMQVYHTAHPAVEWDWNPIQRLIERVRADILAEMDRQGITVDAARLDDTAILTRLVMKRCIYGVDLNRLAVELAKLSLWLHSFTIGAPLSFLDHHLRWGNSLIGADVRGVEQELLGEEQRRKSGLEARRLAQGRGELPSDNTVLQFGLYQGPFAGLLDLTAMMVEVAERADSTLADVQQSATDYAEFQRQLTPYKQALDLWVSQYFGNVGARDFMRLYGEEVVPALRGEKRVGPPYDAAIARVRPLYEEKRFFHWDLEFPEAFIDLRRRDWAENPGFDAVIGNPPYQNAWSMTRDALDQRTAISAIYSSEEVLEGHWDMYVAFCVRALQICRLGGMQSFIVPNPALREKYAVALRRRWLQEHSLKSVLNFGEANVFDEVSRQCVVYVVQNGKPIAEYQTDVVIIGGQPDTMSSEIYQVDPSIWQAAYHAQIRTSPTYLLGIKIAETIERQSFRLGELLYINVGATVSSKIAGAFKKSDVISSNPLGNAKRFFDGTNVSRWEVPWNGEFLDYRRSEMSGPRVPEMFEAEKIIVRIRTGKDERLIAAYDDSSMYCDHTAILGCLYANVANSGAVEDFEGYVHLEAPISLHYVMAILNSILMSWYFGQVFATGALQGTYSDVWPQSVRAFPVPRITFTTPPDERARLAGEGQALYAGFTGDPAALLAFTDENLAAGRGDAVHDLLAHLAGQMIEMNQAKQAEMKSFLGWLEREIGASPDTLTGRTRLRNYLGDYQKGEDELSLNDLLDILRNNKRKLIADPSARAFQEALEREYAASLGKLLPIKQRLTATDHLIDLIVYRLYGLTDEEIKVVEGDRMR